MGKCKILNFSEKVNISHKILNFAKYFHFKTPVSQWIHHVSSFSTHHWKALTLRFFHRQKNWNTSQIHCPNSVIDFWPQLVFSVLKRSSRESREKSKSGKTASQTPSQANVKGTLPLVGSSSSMPFDYFTVSWSICNYKSMSIQTSVGILPPAS